MVPALFQCQKHRLLLAGPAEASGSRQWFTRGLLKRMNRRDLLFDTPGTAQEPWAREGWPNGWKHLTIQKATTDRQAGRQDELGCTGQ